MASQSVPARPPLQNLENHQPTAAPHKPKGATVVKTSARFNSLEKQEVRKPRPSAQTACIRAMLVHTAFDDRLNLQITIRRELSSLEEESLALNRQVWPFVTFRVPTHPRFALADRELREWAAYSVGE
jgi:hypothetical protein